MTDKTGLIDKIAWYLDRYCDGPTPRERHAEAIKQICIESDDAREYWREHEPIEIPLFLRKERMRKQLMQGFIEQACEAIDKLQFKKMNVGGYEHELVTTWQVKQVIKDKLK